MLLVVSVLSLAIQASAVTSPPAAPGVATPALAAPPVPVAPAPGDDAVVCHRQEETGSRVNTKKICLTKAQWRQMSEDAQNSVQQFQRNGLSGNHGG